LRTIGKILSDLGLSVTSRHGHRRGAARYLCYPEHTIFHLLGGRVLEADFVGKKYITGRSEPLHFIAFRFKHRPKLLYYQQVTAQTASVFITECQRFFNSYERPDYLKVDNCLATNGSASGKRNLSKAMKYLIKKQANPIFAVPRKPFSQASIEGNNSVFSHLFWNKHCFHTLNEIDEAIKWFNIDSE
jgi:hypothetical protein